MILIVCLDNNLGMLFNDRRQSQDSCLRKRILKLSGQKKLWMDAYTFAQFAEDKKDNIVVAEDFLQQAGEGEYCFAEKAELKKAADKIEKIIIYKWNRDYPADRYFSLSLKGWLLTSVTDFTGSSHEKITEEVYVK